MILHVSGCGVIMIVTSLAMVTKAVCMLHPQVKILTGKAKANKQKQTNKQTKNTIRTNIDLLGELLSM